MSTNQKGGAKYYLLDTNGNIFSRRFGPSITTMQQICNQGKYYIAQNIDNIWFFVLQENEFSDTYIDCKKPVNLAMQHLFPSLRIKGNVLAVKEVNTNSESDTDKLDFSQDWTLAHCNEGAFGKHDLDKFHSLSSLDAQNVAT
jgi:hypothetical protein